MITSLEGKVKEEIEMAVNQRMSLKLEHSHASLLQEILSRESEGGTSTTCFRSSHKEAYKRILEAKLLLLFLLFSLEKSSQSFFTERKEQLKMF